jgi:hypothetical protein
MALRGAIFPIILLSIAALVWILSVAASSTDWYKQTSEIDVLDIKVTVRYFLTKAESTSCANGNCVSQTDDYSNDNQAKKIVDVHTNTRALLIVGIIVESIFIVYLVALVLTSFIIRVEGVFKLYSKILWIAGLVIVSLATALLSLSWLTYLGLTQAVKDTYSDSGVTVRRHFLVKLKLFKVRRWSLQIVFWK